MKAPSDSTALYGVVREVVTGTWSPRMHNAAFEKLGVDAVYVALPVAPGMLAPALTGAHALGFRGLNIGAPHKQDAASACLWLDPVASETGAVNTLRRRHDGWEGFNTDALAARELFAAAGVGPSTSALVLGAGGAARAAVWALEKLGANIVVAAQSDDEASALAATPRTRTLSWAAAASEARTAGCIVNATPVDPFPELHEALRREQTIIDWVYGDTPLIRAAERALCTIVRGEDLLVRQGALAFTLWTSLDGEPFMKEAIRAR